MNALLLFSSSRCTSISRTGSDIRKWQMSRSLLLFPFFSFWSIWKWENGVEVIDHLAEPTPPLSIYYRPLFCRNKTISDGNYQMFCFFSDRTLNNPWINVDTIHFQISRRLQSNPELSLRVTVKSFESCLCSVNNCRDLVKKQGATKATQKYREPWLTTYWAFFASSFFFTKMQKHRIGRIQ